MERYLLLSEVLLLWSLGTATHRLDMNWHPKAMRPWAWSLAAKTPLIRALLVGILTYAAVWSAAGLSLALFATASVFMLFVLRYAKSDDGFLAEAEIGSLVVFVAGAAGLIWWQDLAVGSEWLRLPIGASRLAFLYVLGSTLVLATWHSGNVVLGVLKKRDVLPGKFNQSVTQAEQEESVETALPPGTNASELRYGRLIGYLERLLILFMIAQNSYEGLGFLIAAKGLIRAKEWQEDKTLVEYFLIGSLLSVLCAVALGTLVRLAREALW